MLTLALVTALCLSACSDSVTEDTSGDTSNTDTVPAPPKIGMLKIEGPSSIEIELGSTHQLVIDHPSEVLSHVVWQVTEGNSVTVDGEGKLTASALGTSTVKASYGALSDTVKVTVIEDTPDTPPSGGDPTVPPATENEFGFVEDPATQISLAIGGTTGTSYTVKGVVIAYNAQSFLIKDSTGTLLIYKGADWTPDVKVGDVISVVGPRAEYGGAPQIDKSCTYEKVGSVEFTQPTPQVPTESQLNAYSSMSHVVPSLIKITGKLYISADEKYYNLDLSGAIVTGSITYPTASDTVQLKTMDGYTLEVVGYVSGVTGSGKYINLVTVSYTVISTGSGDDSGSGNTSSGNTGSGDDSGSGNTGSGTTTPSGSTSTAGVVINGETIPEYDGKSGYYIVNGNTPFFTETDKAFTGYKYSPLDSLGRATGAFARLTVSLCPTDERDSISHIKPTGWSENTTYASVGASPLYNRSHLLAHSIMSDDVHHENMISGTSYMNQTVMTTFENMVRDIVKSGSDVLYRVTPIFLGDNLIAHGVLIEAYSIEDGGEDICICVYLYNVHPGVVIDYATGKSWLENPGSGDTDEDEDTVRGDVIFNFGEKGATGHNDGSTIGTTKTYTVDGYTLVISNASKVFAGARDDLGNTCLKLGTGDTVASFSFTVASNVEKVYIKISGYKSSNAVVAINGKTYTVTTHSNDGKYTVIEVDTTSAKTVTIATQSSGKRAMIDSIEYVIAK